MAAPKSYFFCGVGGSGMAPLALIVKARGQTVAGSDRARDQGRSQAKFAFLEDRGIALFPQDGSGVTDPTQTVIASAAVEDTIPDIAAARAVGAEVRLRAQLLSDLFNAAGVRVGVAGTSGKSTTTGMIAEILVAAGRSPTVMNGAEMKSFIGPDAPFASALVGEPDLFVSEVDESDGSIALYEPTVAVVNNVTLDHKSMDELRVLFGGFVGRAGRAVLNLDDPESRALIPAARGAALSFSLSDASADLVAEAIRPRADGIDFVLRHEGAAHPVSLKVPGRHNVANALAALGATLALGVPVDQATAALAGFQGIRRRLEVVGTSSRGVTVIDDFAHNPDKITATLQTLHAFPGRLLMVFQPHGFGPLRLMQRELVETFLREMAPDDVLVMPEPVYFGGTVDRSVTSSHITSAIAAGGRTALAMADRAACADHVVGLARPGDRILVMGARDDTLSVFAADILSRV